MKIKFSVIIIAIIGIAICGILVVFNQQPQRVVYIENKKVFESFTMTREMKRKGDFQLKARQTKVDSLYKLLNDPSYTGLRETILQKFVYEKESLDGFTSEFAEIESAKIWNRISEYAEDFSQQHGYEVILGMQPDENIIYGSENANVTDGFISYINNKYEGN